MVELVIVGELGKGVLRGERFDMMLMGDDIEGCKGGFKVGAKEGRGPPVAPLRLCEGSRLERVEKTEKKYKDICEK